MAPARISPFASLALRIGRAVFRKFQQPRNHPPTPEWPGSQALSATSRDGTRISGWWHPSEDRSGTVIIVHGITIDSFHYLEQAAYLRQQTGLAMAALDLRFHGLSDDAPLTFGAAEAWDVRAFVDALEAAGASRPFILLGDSLGGLAAQRATVEDSRIDGAILMQTPGWAWNAIRISGKFFSPMARFLNSHFGQDILAEGDLRNLDAKKMHRPPVLYLFGDADFYRWESTRTVYDWWATDNPGEINETPRTAPHRSRWFILVPGAEHDTGRPDCYNVWRWSETWPEIIRFIEIISERFSQRSPPLPPP